MSWTVESRADVVKDRWMHLEALRVRTQNGHVLEPFYLSHPRDWVLVLARDVEGRFAVVRQYRLGCAAYTLEFPAGMLDNDEDFCAAAARELREETGLGYGRFRLLKELPASPSHSTHRYGIVEASEYLDLGDQQLDLGECVDVRWLSAADLEAEIVAGSFVHPNHIAAYFIWKQGYRS